MLASLDGFDRSFTRGKNEASIDWEIIRPYQCIDWETRVISTRAFLWFIMRNLSLLIKRGIISCSTKIVVTSTVTMSQLGEAVVSDGPAKSWAIGSAGSAPSSSRVRTPHSDNIITFTYFFFFLILLCYVFFPLYAWLQNWLCTKHV